MGSEYSQRSCQPSDLGELIIENKEAHAQEFVEGFADQLTIDVYIPVHYLDFLAAQADEAFDEGLSELPKHDDFPAPRRPQGIDGVVDQHVIALGLRRLAQVQILATAIGTTSSRVTTLAAETIAIGMRAPHVHHDAAARTNPGPMMPQQSRRHAAGGHLEGFEEISV